MKIPDFFLGGFYDGQLKNADFSGTSFDEVGFLNSTFRNCNFNGTIFSVADSKRNLSSNCIHNSNFIGCNFKDAQLNDTEFKNNKFSRTNIDKRRVKEQKPSILNKLEKFKQSVTENAKARSIDRDVKRQDYRKEER